jgi:type I restriction enzyme R subunit
MPDLTPEQRARQQIDAQLVACGWVVQDYKQFNPSAGHGIALREAPLKSGTCDYLLLVDRKAVGVTEAKNEGTLLSGVAEQSGHYAENLPDFIQFIAPGSLPFAHPLARIGMRDCQFEANTSLEQSFVRDALRSLVPMATGAGKTYLACAFTCRLIKHAGAKRVLFLVDRANLGRQAMAEFQLDR